MLGIMIKVPNPTKPIADALAALLANSEEMARINARIAEHLAQPALKKTFITEVTQRDSQGRIVSLRTVEQ